ncbi:MAG: repeat-containing protein [Bryobacterales bacterium]|nr:repeat-containing protein [Bryobacterales bacterium]
MNRRKFIAGVGAAITVRLSGQTTVVEVEVVRPPNVYDALLRHVEPGYDEFPEEKEALEAAAHLKRMIETRSLPLATDVRGASPLPVRFVAVAPDVSRAEFDAAAEDIEAGLQRWIESLGPVRSARFFVLPEDIVRYEIAAGTSYRVGRWTQTWSGGKIAHFAPIEETITTSPLPLFRDITGHCFQNCDSFASQLARGVPNWRSRIDAAAGVDVHGHNGIAVGDIDGDGLDEIYVCQPGGLPNRLYRNRGDGAFEDITELAGVGVLDPTSSALFVDLRNTGLQDLVVLRPDGPLLFLNEGHSRFRVRPGAFRFASTPQGSFTGMAAADYDRDGRVDLYLCTYSFFRDGTQYRYPAPYHDARNGPANFLLRNELTADGGGAFVDVTNATGMGQNNDRFSFAPAWCDFNEDGWPDLYVANDFGRNNLYRNHEGKFSDIAAEAGVEDIGAGMSASWFDYDGDGRADLYVSNMWSDAGQRIVSSKAFKPAEQDPKAWHRHAKGNSLFRNRGDEKFEDAGAEQGVEMGRWAWASDGIDFDNDGSPEILVTTGMLTNESEKDLESFFWRQVAANSPATARPEPAYENGWNALSQAAHEDFSEAGRQPNVLYIRRGDRYYDFSGVSGLDLAEDSRAFAVTDLDGGGTLDLIVKSRLGPQVRVFRSNGAAQRQSIAFRLRGTTSNRDAIGARVEVDGKVRFVAAGSGYLSQHTKTLLFGLDAVTTAKVVRIVWPSGTKQEFRDMAAGAVYDVEEGNDRVTRRAFAQRKSLAADAVKGQNRPERVDTWFLKPIPLPEQAPGPGFLKLQNLSKDRAEMYAVFYRYVFDHRADLRLPVWFLVDGASQAHKVYFSAPDPADLKLLEARDREKLALPFPGKYFTRPERNFTAMGAAFFGSGYQEQSLRYLALAPQNNYKVLFTIGQVHLEAGRWDEARGYYRRGLSLAPDAADGWSNLGAVELGAGDYRKAVEYANRALAIRPDSMSALINLAQAESGAGDSAAAEKAFLRAIAVNPRNPAAQNQFGELLERQNRHNEAKEWFEKAIALRRDYAPAINNLGLLYLRVNQPNDAMAAFRYGISVAPGEASFYLNLAALYLSADRGADARAVLEQLLSVAPANQKARQALSALDGR